MRALGRNLIIEKLEEQIQKTDGGLLLAEIHRDDIRYLKAKIISIGEDVVGIKKEDIIFYDKHAGHKIQKEGEIYHVIKSTDVVVVL
jgi:co-chaperonin GroES (HSP10)